MNASRVYEVSRSHRSRSSCVISAPASGRSRAIDIIASSEENGMRICHAATLAACGVFLISCSSSRHDPAETYYLVASNIKVPYWQTAGAGLIRAAKDIGVAAEVVGPDNFDPNAEHETFQHTAGKKPAGILVSASDAKLLQPDIDAALQEGISVIFNQFHRLNNKRLLFLGNNN